MIKIVLHPTNYLGCYTFKRVNVVVIKLNIKRLFI